MKCETTTKHSLFLKNNVKSISAFLFVLILFVLPQTGHAQMFSVGEEDPRLNIPQLEFYVGYEPIKVTYEGEDIGIQPPFAFEGPILRVGYNSPTLDLSLGTGGKITGLDSLAYFDFGGNINIGFSIYKTSNFAIQLPVQIASRLTNISNNSQFERFRFGSLTGGIGVRLFARPYEKFRIQAGVIPSYGFSFASGGIFGGSLGSIKAGWRLYLDRLFGDIGISLGYKYKIRNYDVDEEFYDYLMKAHSLQLGITF